MNNVHLRGLQILKFGLCPTEWQSPVFRPTILIRETLSCKVNKPRPEFSNPRKPSNPTILSINHKNQKYFKN
jgi:hypothetical protein